MAKNLKKMIIRKSNHHPFLEFLRLLFRFYCAYYHYPNPANFPMLKIKNETIYAVTKVMAHIVAAHL